MRRDSWADEAIDLLINDWRPRHIAQRFKLTEAGVIDRLSEAGVEFRGKLGREHAARRADQLRSGRDALVRQLLAAQGEVALARERQANAEEARNVAQAELKRQRAEANTQTSLLRDQITSLETRLTRAYAHIHSTEPGPVDGCTKVRLRDRDEAWEFARRVAEDTGQRLELFNVYPCDICPRQPVGTSRFLHITSKETDQERLEARARSGGERKRNGTTLGDRLDPAVLAKLKSQAE